MGNIFLEFLFYKKKMSSYDMKFYRLEPVWNCDISCGLKCFLSRNTLK